MKKYIFKVGYKNNQIVTVNTDDNSSYEEYNKYALKGFKQLSKGKRIAAYSYYTGKEADNGLRGCIELFTN
jgi:hypothetical protein